MKDERDQKPETGNWKPESEISAPLRGTFSLSPFAFSLSPSALEPIMLRRINTAQRRGDPECSTLGHSAMHGLRNQCPCPFVRKPPCTLKLPAGVPSGGDLLGLHQGTGGAGWLLLCWPSTFDSRPSTLSFCLLHWNLEASVPSSERPSMMGIFRWRNSPERATTCTPKPWVHEVGLVCCQSG